MGPPKFTEELLEEDNVIKVQVQGTKPLTYQWLKDDKALRDNTDYMGSTASELHIMGSGSRIKGKYKCQVTNMCGSCELEIYYGRHRFTITAIAILNSTFFFRSICQ